MKHIVAYIHRISSHPPTSARAKLNMSSELPTYSTKQLNEMHEAQKKSYCESMVEMFEYTVRKNIKQVAADRTSEVSRLSHTVYPLDYSSGMLYRRRKLYEFQTVCGVDVTQKMIDMMSTAFPDAKVHRSWCPMNGPGTVRVHFK